MATGPSGSLPSDSDWDLIISRIVDARCLPFLGAGVSLGSPGAFMTGP